MKQLLLIAAIAAITFLAGCEKEEQKNPNNELYKVMLNDYLWYDKMPSVSLTSYPSPVELLEALRYSELDRWSYVTTKQQLVAYYQDAQVVAYGIGLAFDPNNNLWITYIFNSSPLRAVGADRGWRIVAINGTSITRENANSLLQPNSATITLISPSNETVTEVFTKQAITMNTVLASTVIPTPSGKVGYFVLKGFVEPTISELDQVFSMFKDEAVSNLIVDLRYNGGGSVPVAAYLADLIAGSIANGKVLGTYEHNDKNTSENKVISISSRALSLQLSKVVFITSSGSASASELLINGLQPHMEVTLVGEKTYGKPVGMYGYTYDEFDWAFVPICFKIVNAIGVGDYYNGIPVDIQANDGVNFPFGDTNEPSFAAAMDHIQGTKTISTFAPIPLAYPTQKGLMGEVGAW